MVGYFYPIILLPNIDLQEHELRFISSHELSHFVGGYCISKAGVNSRDTKGQWRLFFTALILFRYPATHWRILGLQRCPPILQALVQTLYYFQNILQVMVRIQSIFFWCALIKAQTQTQEKKTKFWNSTRCARFFRQTPEEVSKRARIDHIQDNRSRYKSKQKGLPPTIHRQQALWAA